MKILLRGGIWRNTEDAVLIAAIQKYGKNQWARVASLLNRKSPKQCKARWYEWLDPSIKKTEWSRDEEEKLLHLAKIYPCQWRTIAPLVGRTAAQCMERYERLLDEAQREINGGDGAAATSSEEARRLRPGEIDPAPETRPARPDPVDMDEDEKEMLSEARARLANTRGKKAKRKAREAQLDEARRLASLQKRRELKAAGIYTSRFEGRKRRQGSNMDYDAEIPFQRLPPAGFYDTTAEKAAEQARKREHEDADFEAIRLDKLEAERRDAAERKAQLTDTRKRAKLMDANLPARVAQVARLNDPQTKLRRSELALPAPQVDDNELEELARLGDVTSDAATGEAATDELVVSGASSVSLERLLAESRAARTPAVARDDDRLVQEARNAVADRALQTPLLGEAQANRLAGTGFESTALSSSSVQPISRTPALLTTRTPLSGATPRHDTLGLKISAHATEDDRSVISAASSKFSIASSRQLRRGLSSLPAPKYVHEIDAPPTAPAEEEQTRQQQQAGVIDAAEADALNLAAAKETERARMALRSSAVKADLPRPRQAPEEFVPLSSHPAAQIIATEAAALLIRDAFHAPVKGTKRPVNPPAKIIDDDDLKEADLDRARQLIGAEVVPCTTDFADAASKLHTAKLNETVYFPDTNSWGTVSRAPSAAALVAAFRANFEVNRAQMAKGATRAARIEDRIEPKLEPFVKRANELRQAIADGASRLDRAVIQTACFKRLHNLEKKALPSRLARITKDVQLATSREANLQREYARLSHKLREIEQTPKTTDTDT